MNGPLVVAAVGLGFLAMVLVVELITGIAERISDRRTVAAQDEAMAVANSGQSAPNLRWDGLDEVWLRRHMKENGR